MTSLEKSYMDSLKRVHLYRQLLTATTDRKYIERLHALIQKDMKYINLLEVQLVQYYLA